MSKLTENDFIDAINSIAMINEMQEAVSDVYNEYSDKLLIYSTDLGFTPTLETTLVDTLEKMFDDTENGWICWWLYETDHGTNHAEVSDSEHAETKTIDTPKKLYHLLMDEWEEI